jgi:hypothetical protein
MPIIHIEKFSKRSSADIGSYSAQFIRNRQRKRVIRLPCDGVDCPRCHVSYSCAGSRGGLQGSILLWPGTNLMILAIAALLTTLG